MSASRMIGRAGAISHATRLSQKSAASSWEATARDEAFADYSETNVDGQASGNWRLATRQLIADISAQLESLDSQRRQLTKLLDNVQMNHIVAH